MEHTISQSVLQETQSILTPCSQLLNEIMPMIYKRFTEKSAEEWRQIYKALQLLEFLIKNGSERVIDDARSHLTLLKMLRQFHYIDQNGKDQGVNVRNRAEELARLLSDVDRIRAERKKARANRSKYSGVEGGSGLGGGMSSGSRYGGFGSEEHSSYGGYSGGVYGDGGGFGGQSSDFQDSGHHGESSLGSRREKFDEYDEYDEGAVAAPGRRQGETHSSSSTSRRKPAEKVSKPAPAPKKAPEVDLFSFDDPIPTAPAAAPAASNTLEDDDFDDFQSATPAGAAPQASASQSLQSLAAPPTSTITSSTQYAAPQPVSAPKAVNLTDLVGFSSISPAPSVSTTNSTANYSAFSPPASTPAAAIPRPAAPTGYQSTQPNYFTSVQAPSTSTATTNVSSPAGSSIKSPPIKSSGGGGDAFGNLWAGASKGIKKTGTLGSGPALGQLAKEKASAGIWGTTGTSTNAGASVGGNSVMGQQQSMGGASGAQSTQPLGNGLDDLLG